MSVQAAMTYLRVLREGRGLSRAALARQSGVDPKQIYRWERGKNRPPAGALAVLIGVLCGDVDVVQGLLADDTATAMDGEALARKLLGPTIEERIRQLQQDTDPDELDAILDEVRKEIDRDSSVLAFLRDFLAGRRARRDPSRD